MKRYYVKSILLFLGGVWEGIVAYYHLKQYLKYDSLEPIMSPILQFISHFIGDWGLITAEIGLSFALFSFSMNYFSRAYRER